jgi:hypothetical protein
MPTKGYVLVYLFSFSQFSVKLTFYSYHTESLQNTPLSPTMSVNPSRATIPEEFICHLSHQVMTDPVMSVHGYSFQREAILHWLGPMYNDFCPCTGKPMSMKDIVSNRSLQSRICTWNDENGYSSSSSCANIMDPSDQFCEAEYVKKLGILNNEYYELSLKKNNSTVTTKSSNKEEVPRVRPII